MSLGEIIDTVIRCECGLDAAIILAFILQYTLAVGWWRNPISRLKVIRDSVLVVILTFGSFGFRHIYFQTPFHGWFLVLGLAALGGVTIAYMFALHNVLGYWLPWSVKTKVFTSRSWRVWNRGS